MDSVTKLARALERLPRRLPTIVNHAPTPVQILAGSAGLSRVAAAAREKAEQLRTSDLDPTRVDEIIGGVIAELARIRSTGARPLVIDELGEVWIGEELDGAAVPAVAITGEQLEGLDRGELLELAPEHGALIVALLELFRPEPGHLPGELVG